MERLKISIITICYNAENTIERTIESVLDQDYENLEYIIIDGGSSDSTVDIIQKYNDKKIRWISEKDDGISDAFNKGIGMARGDLIGLINADDYLVPHALANLALAYRDNIDVIYGNTVIFDEENKLKILKQAGNEDGLQYEMPFIHQSSLVRKEAYNKFGLYSKNYNICMDYELFSRFYRDGARFQFVDTTVSCFTYGGTSCKHPFRTINENMSIAKKYGLEHKKAIQYKIKMYTRNGIKIVLTKMKLWKFLYTHIKRSSIFKEEVQ